MSGSTRDLIDRLAEAMKLILPLVGGPQAAAYLILAQSLIQAASELRKIFGADADELERLRLELEAKVNAHTDAVIASLRGTAAGA